jgi:hypothetical protein
VEAALQVPWIGGAINQNHMAPELKAGFTVASSTTEFMLYSWLFQVATGSPPPTRILDLIDEQLPLSLLVDTMNIDADVAALFQAFLVVDPQKRASISTTASLVSPTATVDCIQSLSALEILFNEQMDTEDQEFQDFASSLHSSVSYEAPPPHKPSAAAVQGIRSERPPISLWNPKEYAFSDRQQVPTSNSFFFILPERSVKLSRSKHYMIGSIHLFLVECHHYRYPPCRLPPPFLLRVSFRKADWIRLRWAHRI